MHVLAVGGKSREPCPSPGLTSSPRPSGPSARQDRRRKEASRARKRVRELTENFLSEQDPDREAS